MGESFAQLDIFLGGAAGWNRYGYVCGNPVNYTDPSGHNPLRDWFTDNQDVIAKGVITALAI